MLQIYTDAATQNQTGPSGVGILIIHQKQQIQLSIPLIKHYTNHQAEFIAQIIAFKYIYQKFKNYDELLLFHTDSKIVAQTIGKNHATANFADLYQDLQGYYAQANAFCKWIPESQNKGADNLAKQALAKALQGQTNNYGY